MAQVFRPRSTMLFRVVIVAVAVAVAALAGGGWLAVRSDRAWAVGEAPEQPVRFRHDLHAGTLGLDCRYCHVQVERAAFAGIPAADVCMGCHREVWKGASVLAPVRGSAETGEPLAWSRVNDLPGHAYFHHGVHVSKGIGCAECHGPVHTMAAVSKAQPLSMLWCLDCHRAQPAAGRLHPLTDCSLCHR